MTATPKGYVMLFREKFFDSLKHADLLSLVSALQDTVDMLLLKYDPGSGLFHSGLYLDAKLGGGGYSQAQEQLTKLGLNKQ